MYDGYSERIREKRMRICLGDVRLTCRGKKTLKEPVATRLVCKLADIVVRYVAARYTYIYAQSLAYSQVYIASKR